MRHFWIAVGILLGGGQGFALPPPKPSAGVIEREIQKEYEGKRLEPYKEIPSIDIQIPEEQYRIADGKKVWIERIEIEGNEAFSSQEICSWLDGCVRQKLTMREIHGLCDRIRKHYVDAGYFLARAYPPPQVVERGVLRLEVLEGRLGNIEVVGNQRYSSRFILRYFQRLQGRALQYNSLMRAILLVNEMSDLTVAAVLKKGKEVGAADLILEVKDARPIHFYANCNNYGRKLTTNYRIGGRFDWGNFVTYGDTFSFTEVVGFPMDALYFTDAKYKIPLNANGSFLGAEYLYSKFEVEELRSLRLRGESIIATLKGEHALYRRRSVNVDLFSYFDYKQIKNYTHNVLTSFDKLRVLTVGAVIDHYNPAQGRDYLTLRVGYGIPGFLGGLKVDAPESSRLGAGGRFIKINADYDRLQHLWRDYFIYLHVSGQFAPNKLTLPEQIYIGGSDTVRGYPLACALGDSGYYGNVELRIPPPLLANQRFFVAKKTWREVIQVVGFLDQGGVFLDGGGEFFQTTRRIFLWGSGLGVRVHGIGKLGLSVDVGWPLNHKQLSSGAFTYIKITGQLF